MACNERVGKGVITYPCTLADGHTGPHTSNESTASQRERKRWETDQEQAVRHQASGLAEFQGQAQTTAQRYTENPTAVPVSQGRARLHQGCTSRECLVYDGDHSNRMSAYKECPYNPPPPVSGRPTGSVDVELPEPVLVETDVTGRSEEIPWRETPAEPTKQREGDQVLPTKNDHPDIQSMVIADIEVRRQVGISRYGTALQPHNGRDMLLDAYEEAMDLCIYLKGVMVERDSPA